MSKPSFALAISATRQSGKDTLCRHLHSLNPRLRRAAFADGLKRDLYPFILEFYGFDIWNCTPEQKEIARPLLIAHGMCMRAIDPLHWVKRSISDMEKELANDPSIIPVWTDCRFENEALFLRETFSPSFSVINVTRNGAPPPTEEEEKHFRQVAAMADYHLIWGNDSEQEQLDRAREVMRWIGVEENR